MKRTFLLGILCLGQALSAAAQITGTVTDKLNKKPLARIAVSDGLHVVKTDAAGRFSLPDNPKARFVFVTTPSGYQPSGRHYIPVSSGAAYHFELLPGGPQGAFEFIQITDSETPRYGPWIDNLKEYVKTNPTAFLVHTGDICYTPGLDFHARNVRSEQMGLPTYYTIGNHDLVKGDYGEQYYERLFGPAWYSFDAGNVHFLALPMLGGDHQPSYRRSDILAWIKNDLKQADPAKRIIILCHDLWFQGDDLVFKANRTDSIDFADYPLEAYLYGHWHSQYARRVAGAMTFCTSTPDKAGIDHSPACFRVINVDAQGRVTDKTRMRYTNIDGTLTMAYPTEADTLTTGENPLRVTAYRTVSPTRSVRVGVVQKGKAAAWTTLSQQTDWAWSGTLRFDRPGEQLLQVEALFADGTRLVEHARVQVESPADKPSLKLGGDWANLGGTAAHNGVLPGGDASQAPRYVWSANLGSNAYMAAPVVARGRVFAAAIDDDNLKNCHIAAFDAATGKELWRYHTENSVRNTMVYDQGLLFALDQAANLYALDEASGQLRWKQSLSEHILPVHLQGLAIDGGVLYAGQAASFSAIDPATGRIIWKNSGESGGEGTTSTLTVGEGVVLASSHWNALFAHDIKDGSLLWKKNDQNSRFRDGSPTIYDGNVYLASGNQLSLINPRSGDVLKQAATDFSLHAATAPVVTRDRVYVATADKGVAAFNRLTFKQEWNYNTAPAMVYTVPYTQNYECTVETSPVLIGNTLVFGASDGHLYGVDAATGRFCWKRNLGAPIIASAAVSGNAMFVLDFSGNLYCFVFGAAEKVDR